jgi:hypothetical protein
MNKLSKEKTNQLILVAAGTAAVLAIIIFGLIRSQYNSLSQIKNNTSAAQTQLQNIKDTIKRSDTVEAELIDASYNLAQSEQDMASGDIYAWTYDTIRRFKSQSQYKDVDIPQIGQPEIGDVDLLPNFPYKQVKFVVSGTAFYHDFGRFAADFENSFPHMRLIDLTLQPAGTGNEKLSFSMEIVALVKPNPTTPK